MSASSVLVGTSGWTYSSWDGTFYPPSVKGAQRLPFYAREFPAVELNASYYRWPGEATWRGWAGRLPAGFEMAVKAPKDLTHVRHLADPADWCAKITASLDLLGEHAGPFVVQLPRTMPRDDDALEGLLTALPERVRTVVEFQHDSWYDAAVYALLDRHGAGLIASSRPDVAPVLQITGRTAYVRFHGTDPKKRYAGSYPDEELGLWADRLRGWAGDGRMAYAFFNNDMEGAALANARTLIGLVTGPVIADPATAGGGAGRPPGGAPHVPTPPPRPHRQH